MAETGRLAGKVAIVTGTGQGIGEAIARAFIASDAAGYNTRQMLGLNGGTVM